MNSQSLDFRRILTSVAILSLLAYFCLTWLNMIADHYERTGSDFMGFYTFGRITQAKGVAHIYSIEEQQNLQELIVGHPVTPIFYTHLPFIAPIAAVLVNDDYVASFKKWALILVFLNAINVLILLNLLEISHFTKENLLVLGIGAFLFDPTFSGLMNGQDTAILLMGAAIWAWGFFSKKYILSGLGLCLTTVRPQIALFLALPFFFHHRRVFWGCVIGSSVLAALSIGLLGVDGTGQFLESIRYIESTVWHEAHALGMPTLSGIVRRNLTIPDPEPVKNLIWMFYLLGIAGFCVLWYRRSEITEREIGLLSIASIVLLPYSHYHDLVLLLIPVFCILRIYQKVDTIHQKNLVLFPLIVSWFFLLGFLGSGALKFPVVYVTMIVLGYLLIKSGKLLPKIASPLSGPDQS